MSFKPPTVLPSVFADDGEESDICASAEKTLQQLKDSDSEVEAEAPSPPPPPRDFLQPPPPGPAAVPSMAATGTGDPAFESILFELRSKQEECERLRRELADAKIAQALPARPASRSGAGTPLQPRSPVAAGLVWRQHPKDSVEYILDTMDEDGAEPSSGSRQRPASLQKLESVLSVDAALVAANRYPVRLESLSAYLASLTLGSSASDADATFVRRKRLDVHEPALAGLAVQLSETLGSSSSLPEELVSAMLTGQDNSLAAVGLPSGQDLPFGSPCMMATDPLPAASGLPPWRSLLGGRLQSVDPTVCGALREVPELPNPFIVCDDLPRLVDDMLVDIPETQRDLKRCHPLTPLQHYPSLYRGPGGLLPNETPRQLAQNAVVATILNRLCGNVLITLSICAGQASGAPQKQSAEEAELAAARAAMAQAEDELVQAKLEEAVAQQELKAFRQSLEGDMDKEKELVSKVGWKAGVLRRSEEELVSCRQRENDAVKAWAEALGKNSEQVQWYDLWAPLPSAAAKAKLFGVRLTRSSPLHYTLADFLQSLQGGYGAIKKHSLETAFVRSALDEALLCACDEAGGGAFTHLPAPATVGTGLLAPGSSEELVTVKPEHRLLLRMQGPQCGFTVLFGGVRGPGSQMLSGFVGLDTHPTVYVMPWNPLEYGEVLWAREAEETFNLLPLIASVSALADDLTVGIGPFAPSCQWSATAVPSVAILQAAAAGESGHVRLWPVAFPQPVHARWSFLLKAMRHLVIHRLAEGLEVELDLTQIREEILPPVLQALAKVPDDFAGRDAVAAVGTFASKLQRMESSLLPQVPLRGAVALGEELTKITQSWSQFLEDTG
eukprot:TRINITY_DN27293_c0_g1_i1.p1 TRINITY_DN27293_c0_g1~~TRINITY_DN27293_c0_g1_i1.p1  ORF type:complete len:843 (-),score=196.89 TRINITY_DN27293_c0_g1_i1:41-2569(-)